MPLTGTRVRHAGDRYRYAAGIRNAIKRSGNGGREHDGAIAAPCPAAAAKRCFAECAHRAAVQVHYSQLACDEETNTAAIGRPKWQQRAIRAVDLLCIR